jgi:hypothetical protein
MITAPTASSKRRLVAAILAPLVFVSMMTAATALNQFSGLDDLFWYAREELPAVTIYVYLFCCVSALPLLVFSGFRRFRWAAGRIVGAFALSAGLVIMSGYGLVLLVMEPVEADLGHVYAAFYLSAFAMVYAAATAAAFCGMAGAPWRLRSHGPT